MDSDRAGRRPPLSLEVPTSDLLHLLVDSVHDYAIYLVDREGRIASWNPGAARLFGYEADEVLGATFTRFYLPEDVAAGVPQLELDRAAASGRHDEEGPRLRGDGGVFWGLTTTWRLGRAERPEGFARVVRDLTERRQGIDALDRAAQLLRESEWRFRRAVELAPFPIMIHAEDGEVIETSRAWRDISGYGRAALKTTADWTERAYGERQDVVQRDIDRLYRLNSRVDEGEYEIRTASGAQRTWDFSSAPLGTDATGRRLVISIARDVTARKQAEEQLQLLDAAVTAAASGMVITNRDGLVEWANPAFTRITGYPAEAVIGRGLRLLKSNVHDDAFFARMWETILAGRVWQGEICNLRSNGEPYYAEVTITPLTGVDGAVSRFIGIMQDVSQEKHLEAQLRHAQKMEAIGQLAGGVAHDFNNLLTVISGYSELLLASMPAEDPRRLEVTTIREAGERAAALTRQLLAFSRRQLLERRVLDLNEIVHDFERMLRRLIGEHIALNVRLDPAIPRVKVDPGQTEQVIMNLVVNARDAMPDGGELTIATSPVVLDERYCLAVPDASPGPHVLLAVSDTGCGMPPDVRARVFEPFFTTKGPGEGTGLGLSMVYGIVRQSDGHVAVESEPDRGTTFRVYLPAAESLREAVPQIEGGRTLRGTETVLLVEDEAAVRRLARLVLESHGYHVIEAGNGQEALALATRPSLRIDLLLTDVVLPTMSGRRVAEALRARFPGLRVLFMSGYAPDAVLQRLVDPADMLVQKPFSPEALVRRVRMVLDQASSSA